MKRNSTILVVVLLVFATALWMMTRDRREHATMGHAVTKTPISVVNEKTTTTGEPTAVKEGDSIVATEVAALAKSPVLRSYESLLQSRSLKLAAIEALKTRSVAAANFALEIVQRCTHADFTKSPEQQLALYKMPLAEMLQKAGVEISEQQRLLALREIYARCEGLDNEERLRITKDAKLILTVTGAPVLTDLYFKDLSPKEQDAVKGYLREYLDNTSAVRLSMPILLRLLDLNAADAANKAESAFALRIAACQAGANCGQNSIEALELCATLGTCGRSVESSTLAIGSALGMKDENLLRLADEYASAIKRQDTDYFFKK